MRIYSIRVPFPINFDLFIECFIPRNAVVLNLETGTKNTFNIHFVTDDSDRVKSRIVFLGKSCRELNPSMFPPTWNGALYADKENPLNAQFVGQIGDLFVFYQHNINKE